MKKTTHDLSLIPVFRRLSFGLAPFIALACSSGSAGNGTGGAGGTGPSAGGTGATGGSANGGTAGTMLGTGGTGGTGTGGTGGGTGGVGAGGTAGKGTAGSATSGAGGTGTGGSGAGGSGTGGSSVSGSGGTGTGGASTGGSGGGSGGMSVGGSAGQGGKSGSGPGGAAGTGGSGGASGGTCPGTLKAGDSNQTIMSSGMNRKFIVHLPSNYTGSSPLPVIFDFHPLGGTGSSQEQASGWGKKCDSVGCIAVFPDSGPSDNSWNVGYCCSNSQSQKVDDVQFTRDMIKWLEANTCVDPKRVYASGCSNGGGMSYKLACDASDVIAAVAPVDFRCITGTEPSNPSSLTATNNTACTCTLQRPISVLAFDEGQDNSVVPYKGANTVVSADCPPGGSCKAFYFPSAQLNADTWANFDKCTDSASADPNNSICQVHNACGGNTEVGLCTAASANHCGSYSLSKIVDTAWTMFQKQALP